MNEGNHSRPSTPESKLLNVGEKAHETGVLDGGSKLTLILGAGASDGAGADLSIDSDETGKQFSILVINVFDVVLFEEANLAAAMRFSKSHVLIPFWIRLEWAIVLEERIGVVRNGIGSLARSFDGRNVRNVTRIVHRRTGGFRFHQIDAIRNDFRGSDFHVVGAAGGFALSETSGNPQKVAFMDKLHDGVCGFSKDGNRNVDDGFCSAATIIAREGEGSHA